MKLLIITQKVDQNDPILGFFCRWINAFAQNPEVENLTVIALSKGAYNFPANVKVISLGKENGGSRWIFVRRFFVALWRERAGYDTVFVHMNPEYIVLAGLIWRLLRKKIFLWYVHRSVTWQLRIAHYFAHGIFSSTPESFRIQSNKVSFVGHAIPLEIFRRPDSFLNKTKNTEAPFHVLSVGRITPIKRYEILIDAAAIVRQKGIQIKVSIVGGTVFPKDKAYLKTLQEKIAAKKLEDVFTFIPAVPNSAIAEWYWKSDLMINLCPTGGLDKVVLEAMAAGTSVTVTNAAFAEHFGPYKEEALIATNTDEKEVAKKVAENIVRRFETISKNADAQREMVAYMEKQIQRFSLTSTISLLVVKMSGK